MTEQNTDRIRHDNDVTPLVESLQDQVKYLREQLDAEREATRDNRWVLAAALERIPELEAPPDTPPEPRELPQKGAEEPGKVYYLPGRRARGARWRRLFG